MTNYMLMGIAFIVILIMISSKLESKNNEMLKKYEDIVVFAIISLMIFTLVLKNDVLTCGYHFVDDHEIYEINRDIQTQGFFAAMYKWLMDDLTQRFRFTYFILRVLESFVFGTNLVLWHLGITIITICSMFLLYKFARKMDCPIWISGIFVIVIMVGKQSAVWWRMGPQENVGIMLLMLTLLWLLEYSKSSKRRDLIGSIVCTFFLSGIKESFLLLLPILPVYLVYMDYMNKESDEKFSVKNIMNIIRNRMIYIISSFAIFVVDILIILFYTGTMGMGYAGIDTRMTLKEYFLGMQNILMYPLEVYVKILVLCLVLFGIPVIAVMFKRRTTEIGGGNVFITLLFYVAVSFYGIFGQLVLHAKSGIFERYFLPSTFCFAFITVIGFYQITKYNAVLKRGYYAVMLVFTLMIISSCNLNNDAKAYADDGKYTTWMLEKVASMSDESTILVTAFEQLELDASSSTYLESAHNIKNVYASKPSVYVPDIKDVGYKDVGVYFGYEDNIEKLMHENGIDKSKFEKFMFNKYTVYAKKESVISN